MKTIEIYAEYGVLAHEKKPVWREGRSDIWDNYTVEIPEGWETAENEAGDILLTNPEGQTFFPRQLLISDAEKPQFLYLDKNGHRKCIDLKIINQ